MKLRNTFLYISAFSLLNIFTLNSYAVVDNFSLNNEDPNKYNFKD